MFWILQLMFVIRSYSSYFSTLHSGQKLCILRQYLNKRLKPSRTPTTANTNTFTNQCLASSLSSFLSCLRALGILKVTVNQINTFIEYITLRFSTYITSYAIYSIGTQAVLVSKGKKCAWLSYLCIQESMHLNFLQI